MIPTATATIGAGEFARRFRPGGPTEAGCRGCPNHGRCWSCPPFADDPFAAALEGAGDALVTLAAMTLSGPPGDAKAFEEARTAMDRWLLERERECGGRAFGSGHCRFCGDGGCARIKGEACRHPELARASLEACGFDLAAAARELLGIELQWGAEARTTCVLGAFITPETKTE